MKKNKATYPSDCNELLYEINIQLAQYINSTENALEILINADVFCFKQESQKEILDFIIDRLKKIHELSDVIRDWGNPGTGL